MATKVKPTRLQITGTPQSGDVPMYVNADCFCRGQGGGGGTVVGPSSSCDGDLAIFCGTCGDCIVDSGEKLCDYAKQCDLTNLAQCCDIPTDNCQLSNGCGYQKVSCMACDFTSPNNNTYPTTEAVCCYVGTKIANAYIYKGTVNTYEDLPTTGLTSGDVYNVVNAHTTYPEFPAGANLAWNGSDWDILGGIVDLSSYAKCCDIPTDNCQLSNGCGYTTCTGTLVPNDIANLAQCCDIPTNNCQLLNGCGYTTCTGTVSTCADVISALGYTPYNSTNPNGYTTCTGTVTNADLACYTKCCDMPDMSCYQTKACMVCNLTGADNNHYPSAKAVADALSCAGAGDMLKSVYDPNNHSADAFDYCNFTNTPTIPTNNCQLTNGCGYTTCTGTLSSCSDVISALGFTPYNSTNPNGYTTCTGTVVASDLTPYAKSCDLCTVATSGKYCDLTGQPTIPTDNCQLANGCGYTTCTGTVSTCADIISKLGYTPYNSTNPAGYTTCTGTVVASDIANLAQCCDIPTNNCQLTNGCGYTTCTGTLVSSDIACVNGCCLTNGGDITISGGADYSWCTQTISGGNVTLCLRTIVNVPTSDFTLVKPATLLDGEEYAIRVISETSYCMCLGSCFTNPRNVDTCLSGNATDQYVFLSIGGELELQPLVDTGA